ncbi:MAG: hypothetical protein Nk1A_8430 [Endomicrobiia bacterium]|nr:MAG: hypothetical protein Nk1A_8430 [Endomicrobiia bacterium]
MIKTYKLGEEVLLVRYKLIATITEVKNQVITLEAGNNIYNFAESELEKVDGTFKMYGVSLDKLDSDIHRKLLTVGDTVCQEDVLWQGSFMTVERIEGNKVFYGDTLQPAGDWYHDLQDIYYEKHLGYIINSGDAQVNTFFPTCSVSLLTDNNIRVSKYYSKKEDEVASCRITGNRNTNFLSNFGVNCNNDTKECCTKLINHITRLSTKEVSINESQGLDKKFLKSVGFTKVLKNKNNTQYIYETR